MATDLKPALAGSLVLHVLVLGAGMIAFPQTARLITNNPVPVTIVTRAPTPDLRPAIEAPEPEPAASPEPEPSPEPPAEAAPTPAPTPPRPTPPPPQPKAAPTPRPQPTLDLDALASRLPQPKQEARRQQTLDLNALASQMPRRNAQGQRGPARPETAAEARPAAGAAQGLTADEASLLAAKLIRLWRPNCGVEGAANVQVRVNIQLLPSGALAAPPRVYGPQANDPVWAAAAQRALSAVAQGAPYDELPRARHAQWKEINFNFNARQACGGM